MAVAFISLPLTLEPVAGENPLTAHTESVQHPGHHSLTAQGFPRYELTDHFKRRDEHLSGHRADSPDWDSNFSPQIRNLVR